MGLFHLILNTVFFFFLKNFKYAIKSKEIQPQTKKTAKRGKAVSVIKPPMYVAIGTAIIVETKALIAAPL